MTKKIDEGYIKFNCDWTFKPLQINIPEDLLFYRDKLHELKLIGHIENLNIGYGNISIKTDDGIIVSGTQTALEALDLNLSINFSVSCICFC